MPNQEFLANPKPAPELNIPQSEATVTVRIIDSTSRLVVPLGEFMEPPVPGHEFLRGPAFSFLIEHSTGRKILFDLGTRKDWKNFAPSVVTLITEPGWEVDVEKNVSEILEENGVEVSDGAVEAIIWSHWHFDHIGDPSTFPGSTQLIVGPGFKEAFLPAYPTNESSPVKETDFEGREVKEISFAADENAGLKIGGFAAVDFFGDGSFYLLDSPGHAIGHMCGLARVTADKRDRSAGTFILMGGDACHHGGEFRPTEYLPLPKDINSPALKGWSKGSCPGALFEKLHRLKCPTEPFYQNAKSFPHNWDQCEQTIHDLKEFDAAENVLVVIAHDPSLLETGLGVDFLPGTLNGWKERGLADKVRWSFLSDFEQAVEELK